MTANGLDREFRVLWSLTASTAYRVLGSHMRKAEQVESGHSIRPYSTHTLAFPNIRIHGLRAERSPLVQLISTLRNTRSGCGIGTVKRPSAVVTAVRP
jgi:hypothetical protein